MMLSSSTFQPGCSSPASSPSAPTPSCAGSTAALADCPRRVVRAPREPGRGSSPILRTRASRGRATAGALFRHLCHDCSRVARPFHSLTSRKGDYRIIIEFPTFGARTESKSCLQLAWSFFRNSANSFPPPLDDTGESTCLFGLNAPFSCSTSLHSVRDNSATPSCWASPVQLPRTRDCSRGLGLWYGATRQGGNTRCERIGRCATTCHRTGGGARAPAPSLHGRRQPPALVVTRCANGPVPATGRRATADAHGTAPARTGHGTASATITPSAPGGRYAKCCPQYVALATTCWE